MQAKTAGRRVMRQYLDLTPRARKMFDVFYAELPDNNITLEAF